MFKSLAKGYGIAAILALGGGLASDVSVWIWVLFFWIGGAPLTLLFGALSRPKLPAAGGAKAAKGIGWGRAGAQGLGT